MFGHSNIMKIFIISVVILITILVFDVRASPCIQIVGKVALKNFYIGSKELNWFESLEYCHNLGMSLGIIENEDESDVIENYVLKCPYKNHLWVAASDLMKEGTFRWLSTGRQLRHGSKGSKWLQGQPDGNLAQNCVLINGVTGKLEDQSCSFQYSRPLCQNLP